MATVSKDTRTPGSVLAIERFDAAIDDGLAERPPRYPYDSLFVGADVADLGGILADNAREGRAVVLVYPDGEEWVAEPRKPASTPDA
jgi:hypothetical protein